MNSQIFFRVDANEIIGRGHLSRCLAVADMLREEFKILFICLNKNSIQAEKLVTNYAVKFIKAELDIFNIISEETILVLDGYQFSEDYKKLIQPKVRKLIEINDIPYEAKNVDIIINHTPGITEAQFGNTTAKLFLGLNYAMLRTSFLDYAKFNRKTEEGKGVFICFGGADHHALGERFVNSLLQSDFNPKIYWVSNFGSKSRNFESSKNLEILTQLSEQDMMEYMLKSKVLLIPSSVLSFEAVALRKPFFTGYFVDNQKLIYHGLERQNLAECFGYLNTDNDVKEATTSFLNFYNNIEKQKNISNAQSSCIDGNSKVLISEILSSCLPENHEI